MPFSRSYQVPIFHDLGLLGAISRFHIDLRRVYKISSFFKGMNQGGRILFDQGEFQVPFFNPLRKEVYATPSSRSGIRMIKLYKQLLWALLDLG